MPPPVTVGLVILALCLVAGLYVAAGVTVAPYALYMLALGICCGLAFGLADTVAVLTGLRPPYRTRTPQDVYVVGPRDGHAVHVDYAWPQYFVFQVRYDLLAITGRCLGRLRWLWHRSWRALPRMRRIHVLIFDYLPETDYSSPDGKSRTWTVLLLWPVLVVPAAGLAGLTAGAVVMLVIVASVFATVTAVAWVLGLASVATQRGIDRIRRRMLRTTSCCTRCYFLIELPVFACSTPHSKAMPPGSDLHRMLRPGAQGIWSRRCGCGALLPTSLPRAARSLKPSCPKCGARLPAGAGRATEIRVAVFGAASAGKTTLIDVGISELTDSLDREGVSLNLLEAVPSGDDGAKGRASARPVATTVKLRRGARDTLVHLFDAPGVALVDREVNAGYAYLEEARNFLFVLDPFSITAVRKRFAAVPSHLAAATPTATHDPQDSYEAVVTGLRHRGVDTHRCRLAFVVSKADMLPMVPGEGKLGSDSSAVRQWLDSHGLDNLVLGAQRDFGELRFFRCGSPQGPAHDSAGPLVWILSREGLIPARGVGRGQ
jgi:hypothetical protein